MTQSTHPTTTHDSRPLPAWGISALVHAALLVTIALLLSRSPPGASDEPIRSVGIVLKHVADDREWFEGEEDQPQDGNRSGANAPSQQELLDALPAEPATASAQQALPSLPTAGPGGESDNAVANAGQMTSGAGAGGGQGLPGGKARVRVFGAEGVGTKFLYLFDRSSSMEGTPLVAAKTELLRSLKSLDSTHQFHIVFFNSEPPQALDLTGRNRIAHGTDQNKLIAKRKLGGVMADGGTDPVVALRYALKFQPDVIFFLTDGDFPLGVSAQDNIAKQNGGRTNIVCIEFGSGPFHGQFNSMQALAKRNGGQYRYININQLAR